MSSEDNFGSRLRYERELRGMTQVQVAALIECDGVKLHPSAIAKMETRDVSRPRVIRLNEAKAIANAFGLTVGEMLSEPVPAPPVRCTHCNGIGWVPASEVNGR